MVWKKTISGDTYWEPLPGEWDYNPAASRQKPKLIWDTNTASPVDSTGAVIDADARAAAKVSAAAKTDSKIAGVSASISGYAKSAAKGWPMVGVSAVVFLLGYEMEAVSFTEFIYYEGIRWGIKFLKMIKHNESEELLEYFSFKFYYNIWQAAWGFHIMYGPLNPFSNNAYGVMYQYYWEEYLRIVGTAPDIPDNFDAGKWIKDTAYNAAVRAANPTFAVAQVYWPPNWINYFKGG